MTMTLVSTVTLASAAASIDFTSIPQTGTDLYVLFSGRDSGNISDMLITINSATTGFTHRSLSGSGASASSGSSTSNDIGKIDPSAATASTFSNVSYYIPNYAGSTNKSISVDGVTENNATAAIQQIVAGLWSNTAAITAISLKTQLTTMAAGTTASLYTITKGSGGATVA